MITPQRLAELRQQRDGLAAAAALAQARIRAARALGRHYAAERLSYAEIVKLASMRHAPGPTGWTVLQMLPGAGLRCEEVDEFLAGVAEIAALL